MNHPYPRSAHSETNWSILSNNKYNPGQPIQKPGFWLSSRPFCIRTTFIWVHQGPPVILLIFFSEIGYYIEFSTPIHHPCLSIFISQVILHFWYGVLLVNSYHFPKKNAVAFFSIWMNESETLACQCYAAATPHFTS